MSSKPLPSFCFNSNPIWQGQFQNHLGLFLDPNLTFNEYITCILNKAHKKLD